jgi:hypothetical protein
MQQPLSLPSHSKDTVTRFSGLASRLFLPNRDVTSVGDVKKKAELSL